MPSEPKIAYRDLFRGSLDVLVLSVLADGRQYGYAIQKQIRLLTGQPLQPGTLYPLLHRLESDGLVESTVDHSSARQRKWYALTDRGRATLRRSAAEWQAAIARMQALVLPAVRRVAAKRDHRP